MSKYDELNSVLLEGKLKEDSLMIEGACNFTVENNSSYKDEEGNYKCRTSLVDIRVTGRSGKLCNQYLHKGSIVRLRGRITTEKRKNKQGTEYLKNFILAEHVEFRK